MKNIASCSFGKDSLAAIITQIKHKKQVDEAIYCRIMFNDEISAELPEHEEWIHCHAIPLLESRYGIKTNIVQAEKNYCQQFYTKYVRSKKRSGQIYGFPFLKGAWCNSRLKMRPIMSWQKNAGRYTSIVGIAADEKKRIERNTVKGAVLPLVEYGITENEAFEICRNADFLSPAYNGGRKRLGCWFCHNQRIDELRRLRKEHPRLWNKLMLLDNDSPVSFRPGNTLRDYDHRFAGEGTQLSLF